MQPLDKFAEYLVQNAAAISRKIVDYNVGKLEINLPDEVVERAVTTNAEFLEFLGNTLELNDETAAVRFLEWHKKNQLQTQAEVNFQVEDISALIKPYAASRLQLVKMITKISIGQGLSTEEVVFVNSRTSYFLDLSITQTIIERERLSKESKQKSQKVITELSSPIVPIQNGIAILPLIGELDLDRSDHIMNRVIPKISQQKIECLIIDFSGMLTIDEEVAGLIFKIHRVLNLLGVESLFTGIRPDLATLIVNAGIDFSSLKTFGNVQQAIFSKAE